MDTTQDRPRHARASWIQQLAKRLLSDSTRTRRTNRRAHPNLEGLEQHVVPATGLTYWAAFPINVGGQTIGLPAGSLAHRTNGKGTNISVDNAAFATWKTSICNWRLDFVYRDVNNRAYWRQRGTGSLHLQLHRGALHVSGPR